MTFFDTFLINLRFFASSNKSDHTRSPYKYKYLYINIYILVYSSCRNHLHMEELNNC